jgi:hypothetical protein
MNKPVVAGVAAIAALLLGALAYAAFANDSDKPGRSPDQSVAASSTPEATVEPTQAVLPTQTETPPQPTVAPTDVPRQPAPTATTSPDQSVSSPPKGGGSQPSPGGGSTPQLPADSEAVPAPIDGLDVLVLESYPPQYMLHVQAGLPSGCAKQYTHSVARTADVITVTVLNSMPKGSPICTMIYGMYELNINLGSDFQPGQTYSVKVNDQTTTFTAQ